MNDRPSSSNPPPPPPPGPPSGGPSGPARAGAIPPPPLAGAGGPRDGLAATPSGWATTPPPPPAAPPAGAGGSNRGDGTGGRRGLVIGLVAVAVVLTIAVVAAVAGLVGDDEESERATTVPATVAVTVPATIPVTVAPTVDFTLPDLTLPQGPRSTVDLTVPPLSVPDTIVVPTGPVVDIPAPTQEPSGLGTDPELDDLAGRCYDGGVIACDVLYALSAEGSAYEAYADTCAGRQPAGTGAFCGAFASFPAPSWDLNESAVDAPEFVEAQRCWAGDMAACDKLGKSTDIVDLAQLGTSCAGRQEQGVGDCAGAFPAYRALLEAGG